MICNTFLKFLLQYISRPYCRLTVAKEGVCKLSKLIYLAFGNLTFWFFQISETRQALTKNRLITTYKDKAPIVSENDVVYALPLVERDPLR